MVLNLHRVPMMVTGKLFRHVVPPLAAGDYFYRQIMNIQGAIAFGKIDLPSKSQQPYQFLPAILFRLRRIFARQCLVLGGSGVSIFGRRRQKIRCKGSKLCWAVYEKRIWITSHKVELRHIFSTMPSNPPVVGGAEFKPTHEGNQQWTLEAITAGAKNRARKRASGEPATVSKKKRKNKSGKRWSCAHLTKFNPIQTSRYSIRKWQQIYILPTIKGYYLLGTSMSSSKEPSKIQFAPVNWKSCLGYKCINCSTSQWMGISFCKKNDRSESRANYDFTSNTSEVTKSGVFFISKK